MGQLQETRRRIRESIEHRTRCWFEDNVCVDRLPHSTDMVIVVRLEGRSAAVEAFFDTGQVMVLVPNGGSDNGKT